jgi:hypothetical protein
MSCLHILAVSRLLTTISAKPKAAAYQLRQVDNRWLDTNCVNRLEALYSPS